MKMLRYIMVFTLFVMLSGCMTQRLVDFTIISSRNVSFPFDLTKGVMVEGKDIPFWGTPTIKQAMDNALYMAGPDFDLLVNGVVYYQTELFSKGYRVTGTAVRSRDLISQLGIEGFREWLSTNNVFDPTTAEIAQE